MQCRWRGDQAYATPKPFERSVRRRILEPKVQPRSEQKRGKRDRRSSDPPGKADQGYKYICPEERTAPVRPNNGKIAGAMREADHTYRHACKTELNGYRTKGGGQCRRQKYAPAECRSAQCHER